MTRTFKLTIAYDGTDFAGWQVQPGQPTIQAALEAALGELVKTPVRVIGSGRTDSGVHAIAQVASCELTGWRAGTNELRRAINTKLPSSISVSGVEERTAGFHAIRDAIGKRYRYQMQLGGMRDVFGHRYRWHLRRRLNIDAMQCAARRLVGRHDFACFQATGAERKSTVRTIRACELSLVSADTRAFPSPFLPGVGETMGDCAQTEPPGLLAIEVEADGFLYNMVRNIVGTLVEIGRGKEPPDWVDCLIAGKDRDAAGATAPAHGLFLQRVDYPSPQSCGKGDR